VADLVGRAHQLPERTHQPAGDRTRRSPKRHCSHAKHDEEIPRPPLTMRKTDAHRPENFLTMTHLRRDLRKPAFVSLAFQPFATGIFEHDTGLEIMGDRV